MMVLQTEKIFAFSKPRCFCCLNLTTNSMFRTMFLFQNLSNNQLHLEGADVIYKMMLDNCYVKSIKLSGDQLTSQDISHMHLCITIIQWKL